MAAAKRKLATVSEINVTPLVDVMLVLLIIFMVIIPMVGHGVHVDLAPTVNPENMPAAQREDVILVAVTRDGSIFLQTPGGTQMLAQADDLTARVQEALATRADKTVYLKNDARTKYKAVVDVVDKLRTAGVDRLGLLTEKLEDKTAPHL